MGAREHGVMLQNNQKTARDRLDILILLARLCI
jgi:hypothetical protein